MDWTRLKYIFVKLGSFHLGNDLRTRAKVFQGNIALSVKQSGWTSSLLSLPACCRWVKSLYFVLNPYVRLNSIWVFPKIGVPQNGWFIMENPIKNGWFVVKTHYFWVDTHIRSRATQRQQHCQPPNTILDKRFIRKAWRDWCDELKMKTKKSWNCWTTL